MKRLHGYRRIIIITTLLFVGLIPSIVVLRKNVQYTRRNFPALQLSQRQRSSAYNRWKLSTQNEHTLPTANFSSLDAKLTLGKSLRHRLPDAVIIGAKKAGTRALTEFIGIHPNVQIIHGETHFFDDDINYNKGLEWYKHQMPLGEDDQLIIDKTPNYFISDKAAERIYEMKKNIKLLLIVRDPVQRAVADYTLNAFHAVERNMTSSFKTFEQFVFKNENTVDVGNCLVKTGLYAKHLKHWLDFFPRNQIHIVHGEGLVKNPAKEILKVQNFLGLPVAVTTESFVYSTKKRFYCLTDKTKQMKCLDESKGRKHKYVKPAVLKSLYDFYRPLNEEFYNLTGLNFDWKYH